MIRNCNFLTRRLYMLCVCVLRGSYLINDSNRFAQMYLRLNPAYLPPPRTSPVPKVSFKRKKKRKGENCRVKKLASL